METKDIEDFFTNENKGYAWAYTHSGIEVMPVEIVKDIAIQFAKQFIDLAAEKAKATRVADFQDFLDVDKQSILDIKQLIK